MNMPWIKSFVEKLDGVRFLFRVSYFLWVKLRYTWFWNFEWLAFRNEFPSRMKFVLHSHDRVDMSSFLSKIVSWLCLSAILHWKRYPRATRLRLHGLRFSFQKVVRFHLTWYQNKRFIRIENRNELISESDLKGNEILTQFHVKRNTWGYGDGMNSCQLKSHSGIMYM